MFFEILQRHPGRIALVDRERTLSFAQLARNAARWSRCFQDYGLQRGQHIAILSDNRLEIVELVLAGLYCGLWVVPLNRHLTAPELRFQLYDADPGLLLAEREYADQLPRDLPVWWIDDADHSPCDTFPEVEGLDLQQPAGGLMLYTSGTTGRPRGVKRTQPATVWQQFEANAAAGRQMGLDGSGPHLLAGPMYHAAPFLFALYDLFNGATVHIMQRFDALQVLTSIEQHGIAHTHLVPTMLARCAKLPQRQTRAWDLSTLRLVLHGAAPISAQLKQDMIGWWGPLLTEYWGGTESGVCTVCSSAEWLNRPGTVGRPLPHWQVFAVDEGGNELAAGKEGLLYARHQRLTEPFRYHGDPVKTAEAYLAPGTITLGDYGWIDDAGYVTIAARRTDLIIRGGVNIYPAEVESVLLQHPQVLDVVVFGREDAEWGSTVHALIEVTDGVADILPEIRRLLDQNLARFKHPQSLALTPQIPRNSAGKVRRVELERILVADQVLWNEICK